MTDGPENARCTNPPDSARAALEPCADRGCPVHGRTAENDAPCPWCKSDPEALADAHSEGWQAGREAGRREVVEGIRAWCAVNEIAAPPLDWEGLGEYLTRVVPPAEGAS